ncbi:MAG TPA: AAA family ATPase [Lapillicoccus sp.]|nr:AAA family ATPase [Lapillicoccus sp.]
MPSPLVGRAELRATLAEAVDAAADGAGGVVLLVGEAGIGKTRLLAEAERTARARGMRVVRAAGWDDPGVPSFWVWTQVIRDLADRRDPEALRAAWPGHAERVLTLLPETGPRRDGDDATRFPLFDAVTSVVGMTARECPLVLLLDDLHWADQGSLRLLQFLAANTGSAPVLVVGALREHDGAATELNDLRDRATALVVPPLTVDEVRELLETQHRLQATTADARRVTERTGGNPLFVGEIGRLAAARGLDGVGDVLPTSAVATISRRVARLSQPASDVLGAAAVAGPVVDGALLARVLPLAPADVQVLLDEAVTAGLLTTEPDRRLVFAHALVRDAVEAGLPESRRRQLHLEIARALLAGPGSPGEAEVAHHLAAAGSLAPPGQAARHWVAAGDQACATQAYEVAAEAFDRAIATLPSDHADRAGLLHRRGDCLLRSGDLTAARAAFTDEAAIARRHGDADALADAALGYASGLSGFEVRLADLTQIELLEEALDRLPETDSVRRAYLLARLSVALSFLESTDRRRDVAEEAVAMARRLGDAPALAHALAAHCDAVAGPDDAERRTEEAAEIVDIATGLGQVELRLLGLRLRVVALLEQGRVPEALADMRAYADLAVRLRQPLYEWYVPLWRGFVAHLVGDVDQMVERAAEVVEVGTRAGSDNASLLATVLRVWVHLESRDIDRHIDEIMRDFIGQPGLDAVGDTMFALFPGQPDILRSRATARIEQLLEPLPVDAEYLSNLCLAAWSVLDGGDRGEPVRVLHDRLLPHAHRFAVDGIAAGYHGSVGRYVGALAARLDGSAYEAAEGHLRRALAANQTAGAVLAATHTRRVLGEHLLDRGRPGDADEGRELLTEALNGYERMGLVRQAERVHLRLGGEEPSPEPAAAEFRRSGDSWDLAYRGRRISVRDSKGMRDLAVLLARPGREVHALDLVRLAEGTAGERVARTGHLGDLLDDRARDAYRRRLEALDAAIEEADELGHSEAGDRAREERAAIVAELAGAYGLGGRPRRTGDPAERARSTVTWRIRDAIARLDRVHPELGTHLRNAVHTGTFCRYEPESDPGWAL